MIGTGFFNTWKKQVFVIIFLVLVLIILAGYFMVEQNRARELSEKKDLIVTWMPAINPADLDYLLARDIYAVYGVPKRDYSDLADTLHSSSTELTPYFYPDGPVCESGVNYLGFIEIGLYEEMPVNRTTTDTIYHIIESRGRVLHHENTPVLFLRTSFAYGDKIISPAGNN
jgi:hypothetical protein